MCALESIQSAATGTDFEILVRLDEDDTQSLKFQNSLIALFGAKVFVGPRLGYHMLDAGYYAGLEREATGDWCWICGDDMEVIGDWLGELRKVPKEGFIIQPEVSKLCFSTYHKAEAQAFPIWPRNAWKQFKPEFPCPFDIEGHNLFIKNGWRTHFLEGVTFWHHEASDHDRHIHRQMT